MPMGRLELITTLCIAFFFGGGECSTFFQVFVYIFLQIKSNLVKGVSSIFIQRSWLTRNRAIDFTLFAK